MSFHLLPSVAREAIRARLERRDPRAFAADGELARPAPVFVTLTLAGALRGCIGCLAPSKPNVLEETMDRAIAAAFDDPRFEPLESGELERCAIEVTIIGALQDIESVRDLDAVRYGIELRDSDGRRGVLLPAIDGVDTVEQQLTLTRKKAGIPADADIEIRRFEVTKIDERR